MRRVLGHALGAIAIALLLVVLSVPALARSQVAPLAAPDAALPEPPAKAPGRAHQAGVRALPLAPADGLVAREFPGGRGLAPARTGGSRRGFRSAGSAVDHAPTARGAS